MQAVLCSSFSFTAIHQLRHGIGNHILPELRGCRLNEWNELKGQIPKNETNTHLSFVLLSLAVVKTSHTVHE